jgi:hypothetical protein
MGQIQQIRCRERSTCNAGETGLGGEDVDKVYVIKILKLKVVNVH